MSLSEKIRAQFPPGLFPLWLAGFISTMGDEIHWVAMLWLIYDLTGSKLATGLVGAAQFLPAVLFGLFAGVLVDRFDRRRVMMAADLARALLVTVIPLLLASGHLRGFHLGVLAFAISGFTVAFMPARDALVPELVEKENLTQANALIQGSINLAFLLGATFAAAALPVVALSGLFYMDAVSYLLSFACIWWIKKARVKRIEIAPSVPSHEPPLRALREGLAHAYRDGRIRGLLIVTAINNLFIMGPAIVGVPVYVRDHLHQGPQGLAGIDACFAAGMLLGSLVLHRWGKQLPKGRVILSAIIFDGLTFIPLLWTSKLWTTMLVVFVHSLGIPFITVSRTTLIQEIVAPRMQGRIFSMINLAVYGLTALSAALTGIALEWIPVAQLYAIIGMLAALVGLLGWTVRDLRTAR
ncbi:MAG: MFS transporter [Calditrichaeota bacterium]|nr:MFS transporter [Calditrichota bacterium]